MPNIDDDFDFDFDFDDILTDEDEKEKKEEEKGNSEEIDESIFEDFDIEVNQEEVTLDDYNIDNPSKDTYKEFNRLYKEYKDIENKENITKDDELKKAEFKEKMAIEIATNFDFNDKEVNGHKKAYCDFAISLLESNSKKPYLRPLSMLYLAKAYFGQTNLAFDVSSRENQKKYINEGSKLITKIERYTNIHSLKAYALTLRAFAYIMAGESLELKPGIKMKTIRNDLRYSVKWDEDSYLAHYALGLMYLNEYSKDYNVNKAREEFNTVIRLENKVVDLDKYVLASEKARIVDLAKKRLK